MEIWATMRQEQDGSWRAETWEDPPRDATGPDPEECLESLQARLVADRAETDRTSAEPLTLVVQSLPVLAGLAEVAQIIGWDKRRVITYINRGRFPEPLQSLASGRIWLRSDVETYAQSWRARHASRTRRPAAGTHR
jgi:predicted DNA-binding transcriptional regulator AlpA